MELNSNQIDWIDVIKEKYFHYYGRRMPKANIDLSSTIQALSQGGELEANQGSRFQGVISIVAPDALGYLKLMPLYSQLR